MKRFSIILPAFVAVIFPLFVQANDFNVKDFDDPSPRAGACLTAAAPCSLREAVIAANGAAPGTQNIFLTSGKTYTLSISDKTPDPAKMPPEITDEDNALTGDLDLRNDINILATGNEQAIVTAASGFVGRIFHLPNNNTVTILNLIIQKGSITNMNGGGISNGGGVGNNGGNLTLTNVTLQNNSAKSTTGGGLNNSGRAITKLENCLIKENDAAQGGGGIYNEGSNSLTINNSKIFANIASYAGGLLSFGKLTLNHVEISSNNATSSSSTAGIIISGNEATLNNSNIFNNPNTADNSINNVKVSVHENLASPATLTINNSTVTAMVPPADPKFTKCVNVLNSGGTLNLNGSTLKLENETCTGNGSAIKISNLVSGPKNFQPVTSITNSTLSNYNKGFEVDSSVSTVLTPPAQVTIQQSTFNSSISGAEAIHVNSTNASNLIDLKNSILANGCSYAGGNPLTSSGFNLEKQSNCISSPLGSDQQNIDPKVGSLKNNGGETETYSITSESPAFDKGDCTGLTNPTDQRGITRPKGNACDIGSFESITTAKAFSFSTTSIDFGKVKLNAGTQFKQVQVRNISNIPITFPSASRILDPNTGFEADPTNNCVGSTLQPMDTNSFCTITFSFTPQKVGAVSANIEIPASFFVISNSPVVFKLDAEATSDTPPPLLVPKLALDRTILLFEKTEIGKTVSADLTITNSGTASLVLQQIALEGDPQNNFKVTGCENRTIEPQKSCVLKISFTPTTNGSLTAKLILSNNDPLNRKAEVALSGEGTNKDVVTANNQSTSGCNILAASTMNLPSFLLPLFSILAIRFVKREKK